MKTKLSDVTMNELKKVIERVAKQGQPLCFSCNEETGSEEVVRDEDLRDWLQGAYPADTTGRSPVLKVFPGTHTHSIRSGQLAVLGDRSSQHVIEGY